MAKVKEVLDKRLVSMVARKIAKMSSMEWKGAGPAAKQPYRRTAAAVLHAVYAYEEKQATKS